MNDMIKAMEERRSIRKYKPDMVPCDVVDRIIEAGLYAASGMGKQATKIIALTNKEIRDELSKLNCKIGGWDEGFDPFYGAPVVLIVLADKTWVNHVYDGSLVMGNLMLAAYSEGIGSCWIHRAKEEFELPYGKELLKKLGIEGEWEGIGHCVLGYADCPHPEAAARKEHRVYYIE
ncbi:nitroreductase [Megasphaera hominis]|uniref:Nitroreductase n=1 Tax=Megasphaera hominis TaxID=159836 RepID=A0ABR6VLQ5_9FIRM|nr:nitroreductase [Megasphaera hominis]MBC3537714.1 nitroreductase [Megasphaera hominis]